MAEEKKNTGKPKTSMFALVQAGKEEAKKVQSIKSVSSQQTSEEKIPEVQPAASTTEPAKVVAPVQEEEIIQENENMTEEPSEFPESSFPKGLSLLFAKREIIDTETIKIPREFHQELKILSTMSKVPMMQMLGNLLEAFLEENNLKLEWSMNGLLKLSIGFELLIPSEEEEEQTINGLEDTFEYLKHLGLVSSRTNENLVKFFNNTIEKGYL